MDGSPTRGERRRPTDRAVGGATRDGKRRWDPRQQLDTRLTAPLSERAFLASPLTLELQRLRQRSTRVCDHPWPVERLLRTLQSRPCGRPGPPLHRT